MKGVVFWLVVLAMGLLVFVTTGKIGCAAGSIALVSPGQDKTVIEKKPVIRCLISAPFEASTLFVVLDDIDVSQLVKIDERGFTYKPVLVLPPGSHSLTVSVMTKRGEELRGNFVFSTRHTKVFEELLMENELMAHYEGVISKPDSADDIPNSKIEANLMSQARLGKGHWGFGYRTNIRYFDQSLPAVSPLEKGVSLIDYVVMGNYQRGSLSIRSEVGDIQLQETPYTLQGLGRRGGKVSLTYDNVAFRVFNIKSSEVWGLGDGVEVSGSLNDHIRGGAGEIRLFKDRLSFKTVYITGGEKDTSYGSWFPEVRKKGSVTGFLLETDFFQQKLQGFAEVAFSKFDPDISDEFPYQRDKAYKAGTRGQWGRFNYSGYYEYVGKDYESIANQSMQKDIKGVGIEAGAYFESQGIQLSFSSYRDNVEDDALYPRVTTRQLGLNYSFTKFQSLPMGLSYTKAYQRSSHEPEFTTKIKIHTDTVSGNISYLKGKWALAFQGGYSFQDDHTAQDSDTTSVNCSLSPGYNGDHLSITPGFAYNRSKYHSTGVATDNYVISLDLRGDLFERKIHYELAGTQNITRTSDDSVDQKTSNIDFRVAYVPVENYEGIFSPTFGIMGKYEKMVDDNCSDANKSEFIMMFFVSTNLLFSF